MTIYHKQKTADLVIVTREREVVLKREELRIGRDSERPDYFTLASWGEGYDGRLVQKSQLFTVDRRTLEKIRDAINTMLEREKE